VLAGSPLAVCAPDAPLVQALAAMRAARLHRCWVTDTGARGGMALGVVIVGGISLATVVTLFAVPALYVMLARFTKPVGHIERMLSDLERRTPVVGDEAAKYAKKSGTSPAPAE
jgi:multidrug efflux pump